MVEFRSEGGDASGRQRRVFEIVEALQNGYQEIFFRLSWSDKSYAILTVPADMDDDTLKQNLTYLAEDTCNDSNHDHWHQQTAESAGKNSYSLYSGQTYCPGYRHRRQIVLNFTRKAMI